MNVVVDLINCWVVVIVGVGLLAIAITRGRLLIEGRVARS
jgi:hypothetical protein